MQRLTSTGGTQGSSVLTLSSPSPSVSPTGVTVLVAETPMSLQQASSTSVTGVQLGSRVLRLSVLEDSSAGTSEEAAAALDAQRRRLRTNGQNSTNMTIEEDEAERTGRRVLGEAEVFGEGMAMEATLLRTQLVATQVMRHPPLHALLASRLYPHSIHHPFATAAYA